MSIILSVNNLRYCYNANIPVLKEITFNVSPGEFISIAGPNGSGKTTLIKLIVDLIELQEGIINFNNESNKSISVKEQIMYLPSEDYLPEFLSGKEYIKMICGLYKKSVDNRLLEILVDYYNLSSKIDELMENYSHGMKKKIQLISSFVVNPKLLIIDETLNGIDIEAKEITKNLLKRYNEKGGAVIFCSHDLKLVEDLGGRVILMNSGSIVTDDVLENILSDKFNSLLEAFKKLIGYKELNDEILYYF